MYGQIHLSIRAWIQRKYGDEKWNEVIKIAGIDEFRDFKIFNRYDDSRTVQILAAVCQVLNSDLSTCLEEFGEAFFTYLMQSGYDKMLKTLGQDMYTFIQNLDPLHGVLARTYKDIIAPSFRCEKIDENKLILHYYSKRSGLHPFVKGVLTGVARELFNSTVSFDTLLTEAITLQDGQKQEHTVFDLVITRNDSTQQSTMLYVDKEAELCPTPDLITGVNLVDILPYHVIFSPDLEIKQVGASVMKMAKRTNLVGSVFNEVANIIKPNIPFLYESILHYINGIYIIEFTPDSDKTSEKTVQLKGQMMKLSGNHGNIIFMSSPKVESLEDLLDKHMAFSDIPCYDATWDLIVLSEQGLTESQISKKLDETTTQLNILSKALETEKEKTEMLLYHMLPKSVASALKNDAGVPCERFEVCTVLFSDIVTFTNIAASVKPLQLINMLNDLHIKFDFLTTAHDVYKVETLGDAYMIVGGVPVRNFKHCLKVAEFALDMLFVAAQVKSPATGYPLEMRIGFHSGPVVAGVVGNKLPRYCLFGDTVSTASHMESDGVPGRIHLSMFAFEYLKSSEFKIKKRGLKFIKGEGLMNTYFLEGKGEAGEVHGLLTPEAEEPDDELPDTGSDIKRPAVHESFVFRTAAVPQSAQRRGSGWSSSSESLTSLSYAETTLSILLLVFFSLSYMSSFYFNTRAQ